MSVGIMRHAFDAALDFCQTESRGGTKSIISHQSVADRLIDAKMAIEAARALTWKAMAVLETEEEVSWEQRLEIALESKIWCSEQAPKVVLACMGVVGMYVVSLFLSLLPIYSLISPHLLAPFIPACCGILDLQM
jgi:alkylation response protein AidB-like acyl-CoA dehydrogenase